jgi:uncharacterized protein YjgD (DUF1641 family)
VFLLCNNELLAISEEINAIFKTLIDILNNQDEVISVDKLTQTLLRFEENYSSILSVSAREPLMFLYFIYSIKQFSEEVVCLFH